MIMARQRGIGRYPATRRPHLSRHPQCQRRGSQPPEQLVGPGVIRAAQVPGGLPGLLQAQPSTAVTADVQERAQIAVVLADDQDALRTRLDDLELPGGGNVARPREIWKAASCAAM